MSDKEYLEETEYDYDYDFEDRPPIIETGREYLKLERVPKDLDFVKVIGGTTYTVRSHFNPKAKEDFLQIINRLMFGDPNLREDEYEDYC